MYVSNKNPFTSPLNELVYEHPDVGEDEAANIEAEKFRGVPSAELEPYLRFVGMSEARIFNLTCDLI